MKLYYANMYYPSNNQCEIAVALIATNGKNFV